MAIACEVYAAKDRTRYRTFNRWLVSAGLAFATTTILLSEEMVGGGLAWLLAAGTIATFAGAGRAYLTFVRHADELVRKVHTEALAAAFGASAFFMLGWRLCERLGAPRLDVDDPFLVMVLVWAIAQTVAMRRYAGAEE